MSYPTSRKEDFFVNAYDANAICYIDDENKLTDRKNNNNAWGLDELKAFVTQKYDRFSRKFMQPEEHARGFVFVRTTNEATTVFSPNERRQIIFNVRLPEHTCLHWDLSQDYMNQLLAEAKDYYVKHNGIYQMTNEDWGDIEQQNRENFNYETDDFEALYTFITQLYEAPESNEKYLVRVCDDSGLWASWRGYNKWRKDNKEVSIDPRRFNRLMELLAKLHPQMLSYSSTMQRLDGSATYIHAGKVRSKTTNTEPDLDNIPDMGF
jgi:predicted P-loop ATPase